MLLSHRAQSVKESITLKLNDKAVELVEKGKRVYNLTAGQLPFKPHPELLESFSSEINFLKSFQYSPVAGIGELRKKFIKYIENKRGISFADQGIEVDCVISNGAKHVINNILGALVNPRDQVLLLAPYWLSYPEMVYLWGGECQVVMGKLHNSFVPSMEEIKKVFASKKISVVILNSPNNPSGVHYPEKWMKEFAELMAAYPDVTVISDEIYYDLSYFDPRPSYFYQYNPELLKQTIIVDGISKSLACTGLRIGYCIADKKIMKAVSNIQAQTTSGANSLVQRSLMTFSFDKIEDFLTPICTHLRENAKIIKRVFDQYSLTPLWYQPVSAFYFMIDFSQTPVFKRYAGNHADENKDYSAQICQDLLEEHNVAIVPCGDFGVPNAGRLSLVLEQNHFAEAMEIIARFLTQKN